MSPRGRSLPSALPSRGRCLLIALLVTVAAASLVLPGCFKPEYGTCPFACLQSGTCPSGYDCTAEGKCCRRGSSPPDSTPTEGGQSCSGSEQSLWKASSAWEGTKTRLKLQGSSLVVETETKSTPASNPKSVAVGQGEGAGWSAQESSCSCCTCSSPPMCSIFNPPSCAEYKGIFSDVPPSEASAELLLKDFGIAVPAEAEVLGVTATLYRWQGATTTAADVIMDKTVQLLVDGQPQGENKSSGERWVNPTGEDNCHSDEAQAIYGSGTDLWEISPPLTGAQAAKLGLLVQIENRYSANSTGYLCSAELAVSYVVRAGEFTTPPIALPSGGCWTRLEAKTTATGCGAGAVLFDLLGAEGTVLDGLEGKSADELSTALATVAATQLQVRVRLRGDGKQCNPSLDTLEIWALDGAGMSISSRRERALFLGSTRSR